MPGISHPEDQTIGPGPQCLVYMYSSVIELPTGMRQNAGNLINLFLREGIILCIDSVPYPWDEGFVIATPGLRGEEDVLELFSSG